MFAQRPYARPRDGGGPEGILAQEGAALTSLARIKAAASLCPSDMVPDEYRWETSLSQMTRAATEARSRFHTTAQGISDHVIPNGRTASPGGVALDGSSFAERESRLPAGITSCYQDTLLSAHNVPGGVVG